MMQPQLLDQVTLGALFTYLLEGLKQSKWFPALQQESAKVRKVGFGIVAAVAGATGITYAWNPSAHQLMLSNLSLSGITTALWIASKQFLAQEGWYQIFVHK